MRIAYCDDQKEIFPFLRELMLAAGAGLDLQIDDYLICDENSFPTVPYDLYIIDIEMPVLGFDFASRLKKGAKIVFISIHEAYVYASFDYDPYFFLRKKQLKEDACHLIQKLKRELDYVLLDDHGLTVKVKLNEIEQIKSMENYVLFQLSDGRELIRRMTMKSVETSEQFRDFVSIRRGLMVNMEKISRLENEQCILNNGQAFKIAKKRKKIIKEQISAWRMLHYAK